MIIPQTKRRTKEPEPLRIKRFAGLNTYATASEIAPNKSPDCLNIVLDELGTINKRSGYGKAYSTSLGTGKINGIFFYRKLDGTEKRLLAWGTKLYTWNDDSNPVEIYSGIANSTMRSFTMNDKLYLYNGTDYLRYDGTNVVTVESVAYIPTVTLGRAPSGGGTANESINLLQPGFKDSFSADGTSTYTLSQTGLDATAVTAVVNGVSKVETTDFTVNRTNGTVTFNVAPTAGTNNVVITAYKTISGNATKVKRNTQHVIFGGTNDTRVFFFGYDNYIWKSGLFDPTYFADTGYAAVGSDTEKLMNAKVQYDTCVLEKEYSKWNMGYYFDGVIAQFPIKPINDTVGCVAPESSQLIENNPVTLTKQGAYMLTGGQVRHERNVKRISKAVDELLLVEANLQNAISVDFDNKYIIALNNNAYVCDYRHFTTDEETGETEYVWYKWDNITASCFLEIGGYLYFGSNSIGMIYKFKKPGDTNPYNDDGIAINAYWKTKLISFDLDEWLKNVLHIFYTLKPSDGSGVDLYYITDKNAVETFVETKKMGLFDYSLLDYSELTYSASIFPQKERAKIKAQKIVYIQFIFKSNRLDESMGLLSIEIPYTLQSLVK